MKAEGTCRSCGDPVIWAKFASGKRAPFDAEPDEDGEWILDGVELAGERDEIVEARRFVAATDAGADRYTCHFATCPEAPMWRGGR